MGVAWTAVQVMFWALLMVAVFLVAVAAVLAPPVAVFLLVRKHRRPAT